jgi:hypothetical protein
MREKYLQRRVSLQRINWDAEMFASQRARTGASPVPTEGGSVTRGEAEAASGVPTRDAINFDRALRKL